MEKLSLLIFTAITLLIPSLRKAFFSCDITSKAIKIKERIPFFDFLKGAAIIAVILIHVANFYLYSPAFEHNRLFAVLMNNIGRFAIPIFFICSGILLTPPENKRQLFGFYYKKFFRIFIPYLLFTFGIFLYKNSSFSEFLYNIISGNASPPYYFIIVLFQFYIIYPILLEFKEKKWFLPASFCISLLYFFYPTRILGIPLFTDYLFFFAYGMCKREYFLDYKSNKSLLKYWVTIVLVYISISVIWPEIYHNSRFFYGIAVLNLLFYYREGIFSLKTIFNSISKIGNISLWIFLIHFLIISIIYSNLNKLNINFYFIFFIIFALSLVLSYMLSFILMSLYAYLLNPRLYRSAKER